MQRFIKAFRREADFSEGETSSREETHAASSVSDDFNRNSQMMIKTNDDEIMMSKEILDRLGKWGTDQACAFSEEREIIHIHQSETWDCGLACLQMILQWSRQKNIEDRQEISDNNEEINLSNKSADIGHIEKVWMIEFVATESIWTIDLVTLLEHILHGTTNINNTIDTVQENCEGECSLGCQQHDCPHQLNMFTFPPSSSLSYLFCSMKLGVDESHNNLGYYKDEFSLDELRVKNLFDIAQKQNLPLLETSHLSLEVLVDVVSRKGIVAIVLLDNRVLRNDPIHTSSYSGHYVVLCGISSDEKDVDYAQINSPEEFDARHNFCMVVKDPASWKQVEYITPSMFEKAWRAKGTDEDVIFLAKNDQ